MRTNTDYLKSTSQHKALIDSLVDAIDFTFQVSPQDNWS